MLILVILVNHNSIEYFYLSRSILVATSDFIAYFHEKANASAILGLGLLSLLP